MYQHIFIRDTFATGEPGTCTYHIYPYIYSAWYQLVPAWYQPAILQLRLELLPGNYSTYRDHAPRKLKTALDASRGEWRCNNGPQQTPTPGDAQGQMSMDTHMGSNNRLINKPTIWAKFLGIFSHVPAHRRPLDNGDVAARSARSVWLLITRSVGMRSVTDALKWPKP